MARETIDGCRLRLSGTVQGVGMRPWIYRLARAHGLAGRVRNESSGVTIEAFGPADALDRFEAALRRGGPPAARIETLDRTSIPPLDATSFEIDESRGDDRRRVSIPPDLATCDDCVREIHDPEDRRYRYPFTNCTNCGPRFTIALDVPYDRRETTMAPFRMCAACQREYDDPSDRRFHAQPNACPACGPALTALDPQGDAVETGDVLALAARWILDGSIVAVKGLGGFHLACDATSGAAVDRLRARKHRDEKPFAVMVGDAKAAAGLVQLDDIARALLTSTERPIVLLPARDGSPVAPAVAPGNPLLGVMLPYTPLHHLLLGACGRPLVMTSGNLSDEPIAYRTDEAVARLRDIADLFLVHDREIVTRCDDSVTAVIAGGPTLLRRSRGFVPRAIALRDPIDTPVLATGALLKNTFCLARGHEAWLGPHIGDLENAETFAAFEDAIDRMERFLGFRGEIVAHDLHPDYLSTEYARRRGGHWAVGVQHHHAHVVSAMAEHGLDGPVIGVAFDGTGYGPGPGSQAWGGEVLVATAASFERVATFRPLRLAGGDAAIRQPWRTAVAALVDALGDDIPFDRLALFRHVAPAQIAVVRQMLAADLHAPLAHGAGRYFDALGALVLGRPRASYEGQVAFELNMLSMAAPGETGVWDFTIASDRQPFELDLRRAVRAAVRELVDGEAPAVISARFHNTLVAAAAALVRRAVHDHGALPIVLTGGCFQNARLAEGLVRELGLEAYLHRRVPPGDGGIALGQAVVAGALARKERPCA